VKYFVKYNVKCGSGNQCAIVLKTRFFNTEDMEQEWKVFQSMSRSTVELVDVTPLPSQESN